MQGEEWESVQEELRKVIEEFACDILQLSSQGLVILFRDRLTPDLAICPLAGGRCC